MALWHACQSASKRFQKPLSTLSSRHTVGSAVTPSVAAANSVPAQTIDLAVESIAVVSSQKASKSSIPAGTCPERSASSCQIGLLQTCSVHAGPNCYASGLQVAGRQCCCCPSQDGAGKYSHFSAHLPRHHASSTSSCGVCCIWPVCQ